MAWGWTAAKQEKNDHSIRFTGHAIYTQSTSPLVLLVE